MISDNIPSLQQECIAELEKYLREPCKRDEEGKPKLDAIVYWQAEGSKKYPNMARIARRSLACPASSVFSERLFSEAGTIYEDKRMRLLPRNCERLLFLHHNMQRQNYKELL